MISRGVVIWLLIAIATGIGLFIMKYEVRDLEDRLVQLNHKIVDDQEAIYVLKAEWAHLNDIGRLDQLNQRFLKLQPIDRKQLGTLAALPMRPDAPLTPVAAPQPAAPKIERFNSIDELLLKQGGSQ